MNDSLDPSTEELLRALHGDDADAAITAAVTLAERPGDDVADQLLAVLRATNDGGVRNAVALGLGDRGESRAVPVIAELVQDPRTERSRGTLLHALRGLDCAPILPLLIDLVIEGSFEVSREALGLLSSVTTELEEETWSRCVKRLEQARLGASEERRPLIGEVLSMLGE